LIDLPTCSATEARAFSALAPCLPARFSFAGMSLVASLERGFPEDFPVDWVALGARVASHRAEVRLSPALLPAGLRARWPGMPDIGMPAGLRALLRALLLADITDAMTPLAGGDIAWEEAAAARPACAVLVTDAASGSPVAAAGFDERALAWLAGRSADWPRHTVAIDHLGLRVPLLLDRLAMRRAELASLAPRDIVLLDVAPFDERGAVRALLLPPGLPGLRVRVKDGWMSIDSTMDASMDTSAPPPAPSIDDVPLVVDCEVGRVNLTIAQLRELAPGQVLDLGSDATARIVLRLNGQVIATGELVRIAERTGVRITELMLARTT
jgi:type III secretion protein Q